MQVNAHVLVSSRPTEFPGSWKPPTDSPVTVGSILATNSPGHVPIKPMPWEIHAGERLGAAEGWTTLEQATAALAALTDGALGAAAVVRDADRFVGYRIESDYGFFDRERGDGVDISHTITGAGGIFWRNDAFAAVVDGAWVERFERR